MRGGPIFAEKRMKREIRSFPHQPDLPLQVVQSDLGVQRAQADRTQLAGLNRVNHGSQRRQVSLLTGNHLQLLDCSKRCSLRLTRLPQWLPQGSSNSSFWAFVFFGSIPDVVPLSPKAQPGSARVLRK